MKKTRYLLLSVVAISPLPFLIPLVMDQIEYLLGVDAVGGVGVFIDVVYYSTLALSAYIISYLLNRQAFSKNSALVWATVPVSILLVTLQMLSA